MRRDEEREERGGEEREERGGEEREEGGVRRERRGGIGFNGFNGRKLRLILIVIANQIKVYFIQI